jgi:hypothetical protein
MRDTVICPPNGASNFILEETDMTQEQTETLIGLHTLNRLKISGGIATLRTARKAYKCRDCGLLIEPDEPYYCITIGGAGLGNLKFPDRVHIKCLEREHGKS